MINIGTKLKVLVETCISYIDGRTLTLKEGDTFVIPDSGHLIFFQQQLIYNPILFTQTFEVMFGNEQNAPNPHLRVGERPYGTVNWVDTSNCGRAK